MENFNTLINQRQSVRKYKTDAIPEDWVMQCVEAARVAPSACNAQPWKFIIVDDEKLKNQVAEAAFNFCMQSPVIVAIVLEKPNFMSATGSVLKNKEYTLIDIGITAEHFCLQATELGLGTCLIGWFNEKKVRKLLGVPKSKRIPLLISLGFSNDPQRNKVRKTIEEITSKNKY